MGIRYVSKCAFLVYGLTAVITLATYIVRRRSGDKDAFEGWSVLSQGKKYSF